MQVNKALNLLQLQQELLQAGVVVPALGLDQDDLHTYDASGLPIDLPSTAGAVVVAHNANVLTKAQQQDASAITVLQTFRTDLTSAITQTQAAQALLPTPAAWSKLTTAQQGQAIQLVLANQLQFLQALAALAQHIGA